VTLPLRSETLLGRGDPASLAEPPAPAPELLRGVLLYRSRPPSGPVRGSVLLLHGLGDHTGRYRWAEELLHPFGWELVGLDWPGCGGSLGKRGDLPGVEAAGRLVEAALVRLGCRPLGVLAHSTGSFFLTHFLAGGLPCLEGLRWAWFSSPLVRADAGQSRLKVSLATALAPFAPRLGLSTGVKPLDFHHPSPGRGKPRFAEGCHNRVTLRFGSELLARPALAAAPKTPRHIAALVTQGGEDEVCPPSPAFEFYRALPSLEKCLLYLPEARHEPFREPDAAGFCLSARAWLSSRSRIPRRAGAAPPSKARESDRVFL